MVCQSQSNGIRVELVTSVDHVIKEVAKEGHSKAQWKSLTREVSNLWHVSNCKFNQVLEILENIG